MPKVRKTASLRVRLNGQDLSLKHGIVKARVRRCLNAPAQCELVLQTDSFSTPFAIGQELLLDVLGLQAPLFSGTATALTQSVSPDGARHVRLRAYDPVSKLRTALEPRSFANMSIGEIAGHIASRHDLPFNCTDAGPHLSQALQTGESDLSFLRRICARAGLWFFWKEGALQLSSITTGAPLRPVPIDEDLLCCEVETNAVPHRHSVSGQGWDMGSGDVFEATAHSALRSRLDAKQPHDEVLAGAISSHRAELEAAVIARQRQGDLKSHHLRATFHGLADFQLGQRVVLTDKELHLCDPLPVTEIVVTVDAAQGLLTSIATRPPDFEPNDRAPWITSATVVSVADPQRLGRVQVSVDTARDISSGWLRVVLPAVGRNKGLVALPDVGDRVALLHAGGDVAQAVVIGGLTDGRSVDMGVRANAVKQFVFRTADGQMVELDDTTHRTTVRSRDGAHVVLGPEEARVEYLNGSFLSLGRSGTVLHSTTDLTIEAPGQKLVIGAAAVDFQKR